MSRLPLTFRCKDLRLAATLDTAPGTAGLLIVSGGNEIRAGAFGGQAELAARIARAGFPVFRFDRRGVGADGISDASTLPPDAIRARYANKLRNPREVARLLGGGVDLGKLARGLVRSLRPVPPPSSLAQEMREGLAGFTGEVRILHATADRTAQVFESAWDKADPRIRRCEGAGHAYVEPAHRDWLKAELLSALRA
jgi:hypothetical protein